MVQAQREGRGEVTTPAFREIKAWLRKDPVRGDVLTWLNGHLVLGAASGLLDEARQLEAEVAAMVEKLRASIQKKVLGGRN